VLNSVVLFVTIYIRCRTSL